MELREYQPVLFFIYVNPDSTHHVENQKDDRTQLETVPEGVETFSFSIKIQNGAGKLTLEQQASQTYIREGVSLTGFDSMSINERVRGQEIQKRLEYEVLLDAIAEWNLTKDGEPLPITLENLLSIEPAWILTKMFNAYDELNSAKN